MGRVVGIEIDEQLAARAAVNLARTAWAEIRNGDASGPLDHSYDVMLVNAGVTHPLDTWLDAFSPKGRIVLPRTPPSDAPREPQ